MEKAVFTLPRLLCAQHSSASCGRRAALLLSLIHILGVPPHLKGYQYLKEAVKLTLADRMIIYSITKELYPKIAAAFGVTTTKVELAIRHTVEVMYDRDGMRRMKEALGLSLIHIF